MNRLLIGLCAAVAALSLGTLARAQEDVYTLGFAGPGTLSGNEGDTASGVYTSTLAHAGPGPGAQGWSFSVTADNATITSIGIAGTADDQTLIEAAKKAHRRMEVVQTMRKMKRSREGGWPG